MTTVRKEFTIEASPLLVWAALREAGAVESGLGFAVDTQLDGYTLETMFSGGMAVRAILAAFDENLRRLAHAFGRTTSVEHSASFHVSPDGLKRSRVVWTSNVRPDGAAVQIDAAIEGSAAVLKRALEGPGA